MEFNLWAGIGVDNELLRIAYSGDNFKVIDNYNNSGRCLICFSGNGLFFPDTYDTFKEVVIKNDRYEWSNIVKATQIKDYYQRVILVRDIYKQWYVTGMNVRCDTVDKMADKLKELASIDGQRLKLTTIGNSAGGYAAVLFGILLGAERIFNFSGQFDLNEELNFWGEKLVPFLERYKDRAGKYYNLKSIMNMADDTSLFYFIPYNCDWDRREYESIVGINCVTPYFFKSRYHGTTVWGG